MTSSPKAIFGVSPSGSLALEAQLDGGGTGAGEPCGDSQQAMGMAEAERMGWLEHIIYYISIYTCIYIYIHMYIHK